ncbi:MAG: putative outer rane usher transrane protein [Sphingomonas bacterium]|uniref:fimbria/pilus outer membrane usher protein n=1 Tax=Sphingomonas bacterium TaxID=1895847 RepID=UPI0026192357|nr:fimbria/pilus outer membrane usher protein [Sphingomonas bacterium]MDB5707224.1 putative outer rane usher transrane protein [Sphingomonas bacterium]
MNGTSQAETLVYRRDGMLLVPIAALRAWGVKTDGLPTIEIENQPCAELGPRNGLAFTVDEPTQTLFLTVDPVRLQGSAIRLQPLRLGPMARSGWGGFLNYDLLAEHGGGATDISGALELGAFSPLGSGTSSFIGRSSGTGPHLLRLETSWTIDDPDRIRSLRIGDSITRGGVGGAPFRFAGLQFGRRFDVQPGYLTMALPSLGGEAALPSVVDVYVNNVVTAHQQVPPGPFTITDVPVVTGSGEVRLVVRDLLGRETLVSEAYYANPDLLRAGLDDYSVEAGFVRRDFGQRSFAYGPFVASGTWRHGLSDEVTMEGHAEASARVQQAGIAADAAILDLALVKAGVAVSHSALGTGAMVTAGFEHRAPRLSYGVTADLMTDNYVSAGQPSPQVQATRSIQAFAGLPTRFGSLGASLTRRGYHGRADLSILGLSATVRIGRLGTLSLIGSQIWGPQDETLIQLTFAVPLGPRTNASARVSSGQGGLSAGATLQHSLPTGDGFGYSLAGDVGAFDRVDGQVALQTGFGTYGGEAVWTGQGAAARLTASGSIGMIGGHAFVARQMTQSFAAVKVGEFPGVGVYADNQLVGRTGRAGIAIVPNLRAFDDNALRIEADDLPMSAQLVSDHQTVRPARRAGVRVDFDVGGGRDAVLLIQLEDGSALPGGQVVTRADGGEGVSAAGGEVYLAGLKPTNRITVHLATGLCTVDFAVPDHAGSQPRLGPFICRKAAP